MARFWHEAQFSCSCSPFGTPSVFPEVAGVPAFSLYFSQAVAAPLQIKFKEKKRQKTFTRDTCSDDSHLEVFYKTKEMMHQIQHVQAYL